jgi:hypothetical protein
MIASNTVWQSETAGQRKLNVKALSTSAIYSGGDIATATTSRP